MNSYIIILKEEAVELDLAYENGIQLAVAMHFVIESISASVGVTLKRTHNNVSISYYNHNEGEKSTERFENTSLLDRIIRIEAYHYLLESINEEQFNFLSKSD